MTAKTLEYYINLVDRAMAGFEKTDPYFKRSSTVDKMPSNNIMCTEKLFMKGRVNQCSKPHSINIKVRPTTRKKNQNFLKDKMMVPKTQLALLLYKIAARIK
ncbi:hypothetical protein QTO34_007072 [Cnephaeus nilssonii]|uniref:Uncharacterized protein n=1 Tax=Cnephaeus nilssonii TaxID=3371016 RepID=A0AA40HKB3_CNENI|nr:hypothetical protein QTO34_007072 [Eptesicus nilssonii]